MHVGVCILKFPHRQTFPGSNMGLPFCDSQNQEFSAMICTHRALSPEQQDLARWYF